MHQCRMHFEVYLLILHHLYDLVQSYSLHLHVSFQHHGSYNE
ncbi:hypothetical protein COK_2168 [Mannheimia haemolytica serotype A2 str. BOVINE]|nr:hypothetical protein COK_2168 [Mannheimia haemolytica serotype A2 str. BOVINE]